MHQDLVHDREGRVNWTGAVGLAAASNSKLIDNGTRLDRRRHLRLADALERLGRTRRDAAVGLDLHLHRGAAAHHRARDRAGRKSAAACAAGSRAPAARPAIRPAARRPPGCR
jgi:hypothetical protein